MNNTKLSTFCINCVCCITICLSIAYTKFLIFSIIDVGYCSISSSFTIIIAGTSNHVNTLCSISAVCGIVSNGTSTPQTNDVHNRRYNLFSIYHIQYSWTNTKYCTILLVSQTYILRTLCIQLSFQ